MLYVTPSRAGRGAGDDVVNEGFERPVASADAGNLEARDEAATERDIAGGRAGSPESRAWPWVPDSLRHRLRSSAAARRLFVALRRAKRLSALAHSEGRGRLRALARDARTIERLGLIEPAWYHERYPDVAGSGETAATHYLRYGAAEGRDPSPHFWTRRYLQLVPELKAAGTNPLLHFAHKVREADRGFGSVVHASAENLPARVLVGLGTVVLVRGWCYPVRHAIASLELAVGGAVHAILRHSAPRPDVAERELARDPEGRAFFSGFEVAVPLAPTAGPAALELRLRARLDDGERFEVPLGAIETLPGTGAEPIAARWPGEGPRVAICMATYHPPMELFQAQVDSIRAQTHGNWICLVCDDDSPAFSVRAIERVLGDDPRFVLLRNRDRAGFYGNFERVLRACPADADFVALSDQDDAWYPDKLAVLLETLNDEGAQLAYSDVRIVDPDGAVLSDTFWVTRRNSFASLAALMSANTVIGAASLFRASLLDAVLPFPPRLGGAYHDHWIALNALVRGGIRYVDRPLHAYVQHGGNVIGHKHDRDAPGLLASGLDIARALRRRAPLGPTMRAALETAAADHGSLVTQKAVLARVLLARHPAMRPGARRTLDRFESLAGLLPAARERALAALDKRPTLNQEGLFLRAVVGTRLRASYYALRRRAVMRGAVRRRMIRAVRNFMRENRPDAAISFAPPWEGRVVPAMRFGHMWWIFHNVAPLTLRVSPRQPRRVNMLLATINFDYLFGGYIGMFNLALRIRREGFTVRIVLLEETAFDLSAWREKIRRYPGLTELFEEVEVVYRHDRALPLDVHPDDAFVATNGWNAHVAHKAAQALGRERFLFMIQDFEPFFGAMNTNTALLRQAYDFPQFGLFSTDLLRDYFAANRIGLFERPEGDRHSAVFRNAILPFAPTREALARRGRKLLFYARPEEHAARNMFEMGLAALATLFADKGLAAAGWTVHGIGSIGNDDVIELAPGTALQMVPKTSLAGYAALLPGFDVGLSLMLTPHPSLVPLEMASAGLCTVTNTFANKTAERLRAISRNLIGAPPTLEGIVDGLRQAMGKVDDIEGRLAGARTDWPTDWDAAFGADTIRKVNAFLAS